MIRHLVLVPCEDRTVLAAGAIDGTISLWAYDLASAEATCLQCLVRKDKEKAHGGAVLCMITDEATGKLFARTA